MLSCKMVNGLHLYGALSTCTQSALHFCLSFTLTHTDGGGAGPAHQEQLQSLTLGYFSTWPGRSRGSTDNLAINRENPKPTSSSGMHESF